MRVRVIPTLLLNEQGFYKSEKFKNHRYLGDPINILKIFNEKEVDEVLILDIGASKEGRKPQFEYLKDLAGEAFMPLGYGGGINSIEDIKKILNLGFEKICLNSQALLKPELIAEAAKVFGCSTVTVVVDVKKSFLGKYEVYNHVTGKTVGDVASWVEKIEKLGAGELILNSVDLDGTMKGYDLNLIKTVASKLRIPVVASGGAGSVNDFKNALEAGASAVGAGSFFVYQGPLRAVLISYPNDQEYKKQGLNR